MDVHQKWMKECTTVDEVQQLIGKEGDILREHRAKLVGDGEEA